MKKFLSVIYIFAIVFFSNGCVFPDKLPDLKEITQYSLSKLEFRKTTFDEFKSVCPKVQPYDLGDGVQIFTVEPAIPNKFGEINVGFRNKTLDWVEFVLDKQVEVNEFIAMYGLPKNIDTKYSESLDYYNYSGFSIAVDKKTLYASSVSVFAEDESALKDDLKNKRQEAGKDRFFDVFPGLRPGITTEREFAGKYPELLPYMEGEYDLNSVYTLVEELENAASYYQQAVLRFENGLLSWVYLVPEPEEAEKIIGRIKETPAIEKLSERSDFYIYENFVLTVDRETKRVNSIGLVSFDSRF